MISYFQAVIRHGSCSASQHAAPEHLCLDGQMDPLGPHVLFSAVITFRGMQAVIGWRLGRLVYVRGGGKR